MQKLKPYKTVEQIAKKHRLEVSFIQKQLDMGEPIEHEHTKDHKLATEIALQHLDEIPDYYTRLKKMETSAKKEHEKFKDVTEGKGLWANIHARRKAGKPAKKPGEKGYPKTLDIPEQVDMQRYCPRCQKNESRDACKYGPKYWDMFSTPISLSSNAYDPNKPHPANEEKDHEYSMARSEISTIISAAKRLKNKMGKGEGSLEAWVQSKITKAADYLDSAADYVDSGEMKSESIERGPILPKEKGKRVFPKGQEPKATGAKLPRINKESVSIEDANGNHYAEFIDIIKPKPLKPSVGIGSRMLDEAGKKCWKGYKKAGTQKLFGKTYNRCVKEGKTFDQFMVEASPAWQRKEGKSPSGGLNAAGRASAKAQGHNLKPPVTTPPSKLKAGSKSANRRKSFCARMGGMPGPMKDEKGRPTRKALSLRKWNC